MSWFASVWASFWGRAIAYAVISGVTYLLLRFVAPLITRRTHWQLDDAVVGALRPSLPLVLFASMVCGSFNLSGLSVAHWVYKVCHILLVLLAAWLVLRLLRRVVTRYAGLRARQSESNLDDVLTPLLCKRVIPLVVAVTTVVAILGYAGVKWESLLTVLGGLSFLLIFLFQEPLSNLFSGVYLVIDVPFKYGDLIILEDGNTYQVEEIGTRVTKLYNTGNHTLAYVPNNSLAGQRLVNLTRPNVELRMKINIGVAYETDPEKLEQVPDILEEIANSHPCVLGKDRTKVEAMEKHLQGLTDGWEKEQYTAQLERVKIQATIRTKTEEVVRYLELLAVACSRYERKGLDTAEREYIARGLDTVYGYVCGMRRELTKWLQHVARLDSFYQLKEDTDFSRWTLADLDARILSCAEAEEWRESGISFEAISRELVESDRMAIIGMCRDVDQEYYLATRSYWPEFFRHLDSRADKLDSDLVTRWIDEQPAWSIHEDFKRLYEAWHKPVCDLMARLDGICNIKKWHGEREFAIDEEIAQVVALLRDRFLLATAGWQWPSADFVGFGDSSLDFVLEFFVDDLVREHFSRLDDTFSDVGMDILKRFSAEGIEIPYPQADIRFRDEWLRGLLEEAQDRE